MKNNQGKYKEIGRKLKKIIEQELHDYRFLRVDDFSLRRSQGISGKDVFYFYGKITKYDPKNPIIHFYSHPLQGLSNGNGLLDVDDNAYSSLAERIANSLENLLNGSSRYRINYH